MSRKNQNTVAIVTMILLFGMISFVTNLAAPVGNIWKHQPGIEGSNALGIMGNMMNFLAYLFMGIPAGRILNRLGSKKTILIAISVGFSGVFIQFLSGIIGVGISISDIPANYFVYLAGAFVSGFSVCMLNTVVNPMLTLLGGEKRGNQ
ncbi:MAG: MFS transporter, partial [Bacteroidales bacterium]|nr:MFS transporter [Bacteroidales bacterium]